MMMAFHVLKTDVPGFGQVTDKTSSKVSPAPVGLEYLSSGRAGRKNT